MHCLLLLASHSPQKGLCGPGADKAVAGTPCAHPMAQNRKALPMTHCWLPAHSALAVPVLLRCLACCRSPLRRPSHRSISKKSFLGNIPHLQEILAVKIKLICWRRLSNKSVWVQCQNCLEKGKTKRN